LAYTTDEPGVPDGVAWYFAAEAGVYANFSGQTVQSNVLTILKWNTTTASWDKEELVNVGESGTTKYTDISSEEEILMSARSKLYYINFRGKSGTSVIKIGTTSGGEQIMRQRSIGEDETLSSALNRIFLTATTIYVNISGGTVDFSIEYKNEII